MTKVSLEHSMKVAWPSENLEHLKSCPVCGCTESSVFLEDLTDGVFGAPGTWTMLRCADCHSAFLNPRPTEASIHKAYERYYTHSSNAAEMSARGSAPVRIYNRLKGLVHLALKRGYLNQRHGYSFSRAVGLGIFGGLSASGRDTFNRIDHWIRHLPAPSHGKERLLDIGCGNGDFLQVASLLGFKASGIDTDSNAVMVARERGLDAKIGSLPGSGLAPESYDHICLSHVLEHLHWPRAALGEALSLLNPGGRLWLTQPNLDSLGLKRFGVHWRGLEPPRHLTLYDADGLCRLLFAAGFVDVALLPAEKVAEFYFLQSARISWGQNPYGALDLSEKEAEIRSAALAADAASVKTPEVAESLTIIAYKPGRCE